MEIKDYFSGHAALYASFRPTYPNELYQFILSHLKNRVTAWDCATGSGQVAHVLADNFQQVYATDISQNQISNAILKNNIHYSIGTAEKTSFTDNQFDLITVAQALHWFNTDAFYKEVIRVGKPDSLLAVWGYSICSVDSEVDPLLLDYYHNVVGSYWDAARKLVDNQYRDILFPFKQIPSPDFHLNVEWTRDQFTGYFLTWSATQKYIKMNTENPLELFSTKLEKAWHSTTEKKAVTFPIFLKLGIIEKT